MNPENSELLEYLDEIADRSFRAEIEWAQPNPSTFNWRQPGFLVTLQKAVTPRIRVGQGKTETIEVVNYLFTVMDLTSRQTVLSLSSKDRPEVHSSLEKIYRGAETGMDVRSTQVLRRLLKK